MVKFIVLDSDGTTLLAPQTILDCDGINFFVSPLVLDCDGNELAVLVSITTERNAIKSRKGTIKNISTKGNFI